ncbi:Pentatricopeptide repeat-containing protein At1g74630 [Ancistrocladus abbreviatus]
MYNALSRGLSESENPQNSIITFTEMRRKSLTPDSFSFAFVLKAAANLRSSEAGIQLHCQALICGFNTHLFVGATLTSMYGECGFFDYARKAFEEMSEPNIVAWNAMLTACFRCEDIRNAETVFAQMPFRGLMSWNVMLAGYMKAGELELARKLFRKMPMKDAVSWNTMIVGFAQNGQFEEAFGFFRELRQIGVEMSEISLTGVLSACAQSGAFEFGKILHGFVEKAGFGLIVSINNALLDTYARCGNVDMARLIFERMLEKRSIITWTSMIAGLAMHGFAEEAIKLFHEMEEAGILPDGVIFISILYACSHAGLIEEGCHYFHKMTKVCGIEPAIEHYGCMVDLYGRAGLLQKAYRFITEMPISPSAIIWRTLLGACSIYGNCELAEQVKQRLSELDPNDSGDRVLLSNVYANAGKWKDVVAVRKSMSSLRIKKTPGWSMIEVDKIMYTFVAGGEQDKITAQACEKLREIMFRLRVEGGYIPETKTVLHDIEEEEKEDSVSRHSEKLAVAFGMLRMCEGKTIRIVKNLRICRDCHTVMSLISKIYRVHILVRDRSRFHSFDNGPCKCGGYW